jgi:ectoine hydroxylase-related dioxygenase (phytanoyl-CoA dioxygenase family)
VLKRILVVRLHLDPCDEASGAMEVIPGSHRDGRLEAAELAARAERATPCSCDAAAGDLLLSRPLLLHRSPPAEPGSAARHRRVLHFEYSAAELPGGLEWWDFTDLW